MAALSSTFQPERGAEARRVALGALDWWRTAGVEGAVSPLPRAWLDRPVPTRLPPPVEAERPARPTQPASAPPTAPTGDPLAAMPTELAAFRQWAATAPLPGLPATGRRLVAGWAERAEVGVVLAMPCAPDALLDGVQERLLTAMMRAIGRSPADTALLPVAPATVGARLPTATAEELRPVLLRHLALTGCSRVLLLGEAACRAVLGESAPAARGRWHSVNHDGAELGAVATLDLATLTTQPACKRDAWADLLLFDEGPTA